MKNIVLRGFVLILTVALIMSGLLSAAIFSGEETKLQKEELTRIATIISRQFDPMQDHDAQADAIATVLHRVRVTIIDKNGTVTGDSAVDYSTMENHGNRAEIMDAKATGRSVSVRQSDTIGTRLMYAAIKTPDGSYIRLAKEYNDILGNLFSFLPAIIPAALISLFVSVLLANNFSRRVTQHITTMNDSLSRVKDGNTMLNPDDYPYDELKDMVTKINALALDISMHIEKLQGEKDKIAFIMDNMKEGFILLDNQQTILLINDSACKYLDCKKTVSGEHITHCTRNYQLLQAADDAMKCGENRSMDMKLDGQVIETAFTYVNPRQGMDDTGLIITMTDVTERRNAVQMRRDFFSNASHELKTPITSIKGGAELLCSGIPLDTEQRSELLTRIEFESEKMCTLINDIIMISRIESGEIMADREDVDFEQVVQECCAEVLPLIEQNNVMLNMELEPAVLFANRKNLHELASNLLVNAIKYNKFGGSVDVFLKSYANEVIFTVRNDGEPIPIGYQNRVFERFFRVDKGRSKKVGGTGLGLSIVKHVVDSMKGTILLESNEKDGTTFIVRLPRNDQI
ncbi:MAG: hypothetical protein LBV40_06225 [Methanomicrobiales archaeon]|nr:hypothetical protein [Methanomicrobiales archaeon]